MKQYFNTFNKHRQKSQYRFHLQLISGEVKTFGSKSSIGLT